LKKLFQILFFVLYPLFIYSQDSLRISNDTAHKPYLDSTNVKLKRHTLFFELGGTSFLYSIKYDCILKQWKKFSINSGIGFSALPNDHGYGFDNGGINAFVFPMQLSGLYGKNKNKLELGVFIMPSVNIYTKKEKSYEGKKTEYGLGKGIDVGYRYQKKQGGLFFKTSFLVFFGNGLSAGTFSIYEGPLPWIGIGIGHTFK